MRRIWLFVAPSLIVTVTACVTTPETGRRAFVMTSEAQEAQMGTQAYREILTKERLSTNARWNAILQRVGGRIAQASGRSDYQWEFKLIESNQENAFCLPGGKVAFFTGILAKCENEAGIAAVMGHEVAHATARHGGQRMTTAMGTQIGLAALDTILGGGRSQEKNLLFAALGVGANVGLILPFSRSNESEADEIGLVYMARAGYDPHEAPRFWERFAKKSGEPPLFLSTHPASSGRKEALLGQLPKVLPLYERSPRFGTGEHL